MTDTKKTTKETRKAPSKEKTVKSLQAQIYSQKGNEVNKLDLPKDIFGLKWNADLVHQVVVGMMANKRAGIAHTKDRSEVSGGGKKPWKQKGTGRARHGSTRSPIWVGGGTTFGPRNEKDYSQKINKKTKTKALFTILSRKLDLNSILFIDSLSLNSIKTKNANEIVNDWSKIANFDKISNSKRNNGLLIIANHDDFIEKSFANLPGISVKQIGEINPLVLMNSKYLIMVNPSDLITILEAKKK